MAKEIPPYWEHLHSWWAENKKLYNVPEIAARAGLYKGRVYAALDPGSQGGSRARYTDELYAQLVVVLRTAYRPFAVPTRISEQQIRDLYEQQGLGLEATASELGITMPTLRRYMDVFAITRRAVGAPEKDVTLDATMLRGFIRRNISQTDAATELGVGKPRFMARVAAMAFDWSAETTEWKQALWADMLAWTEGRQKARLQMRGFFTSQVSMRISIDQQLAPTKPSLLRMAAVFAEDGFTSDHYEPPFPASHVPHP